ncbi:urease accessory protein UreF [Falsihalocynthiibacter sp. SS001]|uniref:urease accessory protein UreF n=1 Tax=Falsihalocynthiibacter sp. SS001 TaxID=3349698 RepID=UPI0036D347B2
MNLDLLTLTQWLSPAFPLGSFAYSHGLEYAVEDGQVTDSAGLERWITDVLEFGAGHVDAILLSQSMAGQDLADVARAMAASRERLIETEAQGRAFADTVNGIAYFDLPHAPLPVVVGMAARRLSLTSEEVVSLYLHAFASNLVSVGVRFVPLGQTEGQKTLAALHPTIHQVARKAVAAQVSEITSAAFAGDISAMRHETMEVRIFKT